MLTIAKPPCLCHPVPWCSVPDNVINDVKHAQKASWRTRPPVAGSPKSAGVPCVLVQQAPLLPQGLGGGWDVVVPAPWASTVWNALVFSSVSAVRWRLRSDGDGAGG